VLTAWSKATVLAPAAPAADGAVRTSKNLLHQPYREMRTSAPATTTASWGAGRTEGPLAEAVAVDHQQDALDELSAGHPTT
jgi:hypothetical protein